MKDFFKATLCFALVFSVVLLCGCGKRESEKPGSTDTTAEVVEKAKVSLEIDINKAVSAIKAEAGKLDIEQLTALAKKYKATIDERKIELNALTAKMKKLDVAAMFAEEGQALMVDIDYLNKAIAVLKEHFSIYYNKLKSLGGDASGLKID